MGERCKLPTGVPLWKWNFVHFGLKIWHFTAIIRISRNLQLRTGEVLLVQSFTARMPSLTENRAFGLGRRRWSSPQQCYLHCLRTSVSYLISMCSIKWMMYLIFISKFCQYFYNPWVAGSVVMHHGEDFINTELYVSAGLPSVLWRCWLGGRKGIWPVKSWVVGCWRGCLFGARWSIWPSWCHCHSLSLASVKSRLVLPFWYWLTQVVPDKGPLNVCVCVCVRACVRACVQTTTEPVYFYIDVVFALHGLLLSSLFLTSWVLSASWPAGLLTAVFYIFNR